MDAKKNEFGLKFELPGMTDAQFKLFSDLIYSICGINLQPKKKLMLVSRLYRRLLDLDILSFEEYYNYLFTSGGHKDEIIKMIDAVSTNKTEFFRGHNHLEYLTSKALPELIAREDFKKDNKINIWSAGCSTGEEPYSIAIILSEFSEKHNLGFPFNIIGTDISTKVLDAAGRAIYKQDTVSSVPERLLKKYFTQEEDIKGTEYSIIPELKKYVIIKRHNLMDINFSLGMFLDIVFCRNVTIYFDRQTKIELFKRFYANLKQGGYMLIGNAETLHGINKDFHMVAPSIYRKL